MHAGGMNLPYQYRSYAVETGIEHYSLVCLIGTGMTQDLIYVCMGWVCVSVHGVCVLIYFIIWLLNAGFSLH